MSVCGCFKVMLNLKPVCCLSLEQQLVFRQRVKFLETCIKRQIKSPARVNHFYAASLLSLYLL